MLIKPMEIFIDHLGPQNDREFWIRNPSEHSGGVPDNFKWFNMIINCS